MNNKKIAEKVAILALLSPIWLPFMIIGMIFGLISRFFIEGFSIGYDEPFGFLPDKIVNKIFNNENGFQ